MQIVNGLVISMLARRFEKEKYIRRLITSSSSSWRVPGLRSCQCPEWMIEVKNDSYISVRVSQLDEDNMDDDFIIIVRK